MSKGLRKSSKCYFQHPMYKGTEKCFLFVIYLLRISLDFKGSLNLCVCVCVCVCVCLCVSVSLCVYPGQNYVCIGGGKSSQFRIIWESAGLYLIVVISEIRKILTFWHTHWTAHLMTKHFVIMKIDTCQTLFKSILIFRPATFSNPLGVQSKSSFRKT